eukprot:786470-Rhodomonas_salina.3
MDRVDLDRDNYIDFHEFLVRFGLDFKSDGRWVYKEEGAKKADKPTAPPEVLLFKRLLRSSRWHGRGGVLRTLKRFAPQHNVAGVEVKLPPPPTSLALFPSSRATLVSSSPRTLYLFLCPFPSPADLSVLTPSAAKPHASLFTLRTSLFRAHTPHFTLHTSHFTLHTSRSTLHAQGSSPRAEHESMCVWGKAGGLRPERVPSSPQGWPRHGNSLLRGHRPALRSVLSGPECNGCQLLCSVCPLLLTSLPVRALFRSVVSDLCPLFFSAAAIFLRHFQRCLGSLTGSALRDQARAAARATSTRSARYPASPSDLTRDVSALKLILPLPDRESRVVLHGGCPEAHAGAAHNPGV